MSAYCVNASDDCSSLLLSIHSDDVTKKPRSTFTCAPLCYCSFSVRGCLSVRKKIFLLVNNTNLGLHPISHCFPCSCRAVLVKLPTPTSTYHLVVCLVGTGSAVLVHQTTDGSIRFVTTPAIYPRRYGDKPFFVAMAQE